MEAPRRRGPSLREERSANDNAMVLQQVIYVMSYMVLRLKVVYCHRSPRDFSDASNEPERNSGSSMRSDKTAWSI